MNYHKISMIVCKNLIFMYVFDLFNYENTDGFQDDTQRQDLEKINHDIDGKLDRTELDALRDYMEKQLKKLKKLAVSFPNRICPFVLMFNPTSIVSLHK